MDHQKPKKKKKKEYYSEKLNENKNNTKATWGIINTVIKSNKIKNMYPNYFVKENLEISDEKKITNEFCKYIIYNNNI